MKRRGQALGGAHGEHHEGGHHQNAHHSHVGNHGDGHQRREHGVEGVDGKPSTPAASSSHTMANSARHQTKTVAAMVTARTETVTASPP
ncbi:MAG: hypothetical protein M3396_01165 [Actinomycetota bacterium]|nr:hypothetical protein [Actinomycetota bacterium]